MADGLAVTGEAHRAVGQVALVLLLADGQAQVGARAEAVDALPALGREQRHHAVAGGDIADALAHLLDDAATLVAQHGRGVARGVGAGGGVEVGVADAAGLQAHQNLTGSRLGQLHLLHLERLPELLEHRGPHLHGADSRRARSSGVFTLRTSGGGNATRTGSSDSTVAVRAASESAARKVSSATGE